MAYGKVSISRPANFWCHFSSTHHCSENIAAKRYESQSKDRHKWHLAPYKKWISPLLYPVCNNFSKFKWTRSRGQTRSGYFTFETNQKYIVMYVPKGMIWFHLDENCGNWLTCLDDRKCRKLTLHRLIVSSFRSFYHPKEFVHL
jgi:hypothetical protein